MVTFQEFVKSRRDSGSSNAAEQMHRSRSVGHGSAQPSLQRVDDLQLRRSSTSSNRPQQSMGPGSITASSSAPARWPGIPAFNSTDQHCIPPTTAPAAAGGHAASQRQFLSANSSRIQLLQEKLLSRSNSRQLARQHTTTTIHSAVASTSPSRAVSRAHSLKQLLVSRRAVGEAAGPPESATGATSSTKSVPGSPRLLARAVMPLSVADALLGRSNSRSNSRSIDVMAPAHAAPPSTKGNYIAPISPAGSSGPFEHVAPQQGVAPAISQQQSQALSGTPSSLSVTSTHSRSTVKEPSQSQPPQENLAGGQAAPANDKAVALQSLLQQQQHLRQMMRLQSLKNLQHQSSKLSQASTLRSRSPGALGADPSTASMSQSRPASPPGGSEQLPLGPTNLSRGATGNLDQQLQQQPSKGSDSVNADIDRPGEPPAVADEAAGLQQQPSTAVAAEGSAQGLSAQESQSQHHIGSVIVEAAPVLQASVGQESSTCSQQAHPQSQQQQRRHRLVRQATADEPAGVSVAQEAASAASEVTSSSGGTSFTSSATTVLSQQGYFTTPAYKATQPQQIADPVGSGDLGDALSEQPSRTLTDVATAVEAVKPYSRHHSQPSHRDSSSYRKELSRSRSSSTSSSSKLSHHNRKSKAQSDILGALDSNAPHDFAGMSAGCGQADSHILLVARQHAQQLQQQNDALVRVLERERQQHEKTRQQVSDTQLELKERCAEWEIALQVLRQDNATLSAKLRKALAGGDQQEVLDAYDSALASSAAKVEEAQAAAAALAAQLTDTELQLLQLQHVCSNSALGGACRVSEEDDWESSSRLDGAAVAMAVAAAGTRSASASRSPAAAKTAAAVVDPNCSRGLRALRQHQKHLEQQVTKQQQELSKLRREQIKLLRFKKQYNAVVGKLQSAASAQEAAAAVAEEAGLRAAAAAGRADRLQQKVEQLQQDNQQLRTVEDELKQQLQAIGEQLKQAQQELRVVQTSQVVQVLAGVQSPVRQPAAAAADTVNGDAAFKVPETNAAGRSSQQLHTQVSEARSNQSSQRSISLAGNSSPAVVAGTALPATTAVVAVSRAGNSPAVRRNSSLSASGTPTGVNTAAGDTGPPSRQLRHSVSAPGRPGTSGSAQAQLATSKAQEAHAAAADALSRRCLSRRMLLHLKLAAQASLLGRQLKQLAAEHRQKTVLKGAIQHWSRSAQLSKGLQALQSKLKQRAMQFALQGWRHRTEIQRSAAEQQQAANSHWCIHTCYKALSHWIFYTYQVKQLGFDLPSSPSTASTASDDPNLDWQQQDFAALEQDQQSPNLSPRLSGFGSAVSTSVTRDTSSRPPSPQGGSRVRPPSISVRLLSPVVGRPSAGRASGAAAHLVGRNSSRDLMQPGGLQQQNGRRMSSLATCKLSQDERRPPDSQAVMDATVGNYNLHKHPQQLYCDTVPGTSPKVHSRSSQCFTGQNPHSPNRLTALQHQQQQQHNLLLSPPSKTPHAAASSLHKRPSKSISLTADSFSGVTPNQQPWQQRRATVGPAAGVIDGVPMEVQLTFLGLARAQRLRRRRLLRTGWNGWHVYLEVLEAKQQQLAVASRVCNKHRTRRAWLQWQQYTEQQQLIRTHPDGLDDAQMQLVQQYSKFRQRTLLLQLVQAWWALAQRATAARAAAAAAAAGRRTQLLRRILRFMLQRALYGYVKRQLYTKADSSRIQQLQKSGFRGWRQALAAAKAADPNRNPKLQQLMWKSFLHWKLLCVAAVGAAGREQRAEAFAARTASRRFARAFRAWRWVTAVSARKQQQQKLQQTQQQVVLLQQQLQDVQQQLQEEQQLLQEEQQQHLSDVEAVRMQMQEVQQQLEAAVASKTSLEEALKNAEQQLQQQEASHHQQIAQLNADHRTAVAMLQQQVEQAARSTEETAEQLQQLQQQQALGALEQQQQQQQLQQEVDQQRQQWEQQQQQWQQREQELMQQVATSKSQSKQLASQVKRCSERLNQQTETVHSLKAELETAREQVAAARHASRDQNLNLTHQALAAEHEKLKSQQQLCSEHAAVQILTQQVQDLEQQLQQQQDAAAAAAAEHGSEVQRLMDQICLKEQAVAQLQASMASNQQQMAAQQAKVLSELEQLRGGWLQSKQIIKQQRKTIKAQELQLQLALGCSTGLVPQAAQQQQQRYLAAIKLEELSSSRLGSLLGVEDSGVESLGGVDVGNDGKYPITGYVLMQQQQHKRQLGSKAREITGEAAGHAAAKGAAGSQGLNADPEISLGSDCHGMYTADGLCESTGQIVNGLKALKQQHGHRQQSSHRVGTMVRPPMTPSSSTGGLISGQLL